MRRRLILAFLLMCAATAPALPAQGAIDLQITEIWNGQDGSDLTADWFELTNYGDEAWIAASGPVLSVNDNSGELGTDVVVAGLTDINPGESAIILMEGDEAAKTTFFDVWNPVKSQVLTNIGYADGGGLGLGSGGDGVRVWLNDILEDSEDYNSPISGVSWDVPLSNYSMVGNASGAVATTQLNDAGEAAIGSPGMVPSIPEPTSIILLIFGAVAAIGRFRRS
jgi:hypothetical protein